MVYKNEIKNLKAFQMWCYRKILKIYTEAYHKNKKVHLTLNETPKYHVRENRGQTNNRIPKNVMVKKCI